MYCHLRLLERNVADLLYINTDGIIFGLARDKKEQVFDYGPPQDQGDIRKMRVHPAIFGYFKNEILLSECMSVFAGISSKLLLRDSGRQDGRASKKSDQMQGLDAGQ